MPARTHTRRAPKPAVYGSSAALPAIPPEDLAAALFDALPEDLAAAVLERLSEGVNAARTDNPPDARDAAQTDSARSGTSKSLTTARGDRLIPVPRWNDYHDWPPPGGMRHLIFFAESNGFTSAFKRVGRRVLVDEMEFFRCVERANRNAA